MALADRDHEGADAGDDAVLIVDVEIVDIEIARLLQHDRQAIDGDALVARRVACGGHGAPVIVGAVAGDVDDAAQWRDIALLEQGDGKVDRAGDRGAPAPPGRGLAELLGEGDRRLRRLDHCPGPDDVLEIAAGPFEIGNGDLADRPLGDGIVQLFRSKRLDIAVALQSELVEVHRIGDVDRQHQRDVDLLGWRSRLLSIGGGGGPSPGGSETKETEQPAPHRNLHHLSSKRDAERRPSFGRRQASNECRRSLRPVSIRAKHENASSSRKNEHRPE